MKTTRDSAGRLHSFNDEPAVHYSDGTMVWYRKGKIHREKGPAIINKSYKEYWLNDVIYDFNEWVNKLTVPDHVKLEIILRGE